MCKVRHKAAEVLCVQAVVLEVKHEVGKVKLHPEGAGDQSMTISINHTRLAKFMTHTGISFAPLARLL